MIAGVGIDVVDLDRFRLVLRRTPGVGRRLFTEAERRYAERASDPVPRLAARFAAKEATMKALGVGLGAFRFVDVEVAKASSGQPSLVLRRRAAELAERRGAATFHVSLSHSDRTAGAVVVAERDAMGGPG